jgi:8-oxo-dGTP pyrophosphatase MutT (NUDIX family)
MRIAISSSLLHALKPLVVLPPLCRAFTATALLRASTHDEELRRQTESNGFNPMAGKEKKAPAVPRPSSSVLVVSPNNQILLLQRVKQSSSFPSAHVFPGGNVSEAHDGRVPAPEEPGRHEDSEVYRMAAIRETFEESGILLARNNGFGRLIEVPEAERQEGRKAIHSNQTTFPKWLAQKGGRPDIDGLIPFTRWVTPTNVPKRFTTQMYIYFLPTMSSSPISGAQADSDEEVKIPLPTTDGGLEHTTARFLPASVWLRLAQEGRIIMFPPQFYLLHQVAQHFDNLPSPTAYGSVSREPLPRHELEARRKALADFVKTGEPPWTEKVISPIVVPARDGQKRDDSRSLLGLEKPGPELAGSGRAGMKDECVLVNFRKEGPRQLAVVSRADALNSKL